MSSKPFAISEDWVVVILGLAIIILALSGVIIPKPSFSWSSSGDLMSNVFSTANLGAIALQFGLVYSTAIVGALLLRKNLKSLLIVFPSLCY